MNELYNILSIFVTGGLLLGCGLMFLFTTIPAGPLLGNYRKARYMMAGAYLFFVAAGIVEYLFQASPPDVSSLALMQTVTLVIAAPQALLFTFAMLALLEVRFPGWRYIFRETAYVLLFVAAVFTAYACCSAKTFTVAFYVFAVLYTLLLARYTFLFLKSYHLFRLRMDNYFSDMEAGRLRWVAFSFFAALAIGIMALLSSLFMSTLIALLFVVVFDVFYLYFAIRFINYAYQFPTIELAMDDDMQDAGTQYIASTPDKTADNNEITGMHDNTLALLEKRIEKWMADKGFTEPGITIDTLAIRLYTNHKYLSTYINTYKHQTFRDWINELRIEEAKNLLLQYPEITGSEVAHQAGFSDRSHFLRQFKKHTGVSPTKWKKLADTQIFPV
jgi:AraC-like DNA-binding protein